jgi:hypothetical protein
LININRKKEERVILNLRVKDDRREEKGKKRKGKEGKIKEGERVRENKYKDKI